MSTQEIDNTNVSKVLGRIVDYPQLYDKSILVREPRQSNRTHLDISDDNPPFEGFDVWNAYEVSALTYNGLPVAGVMKLVYPATNKYIVESKSLKLYLNSFNMYRCGGTHNEVLKYLENTVSTDLSELLETEVKCRIFTTKEIVNFNSDSTEYVGNDYWFEYTTIEDAYNLNDVSFVEFKETPSLLRFDYKYNTNKTIPVQRYHSSLLKSNCRVTRQPDWGDVFIDIQSEYHINPVSLAEYIVSFRDECHFHEEICETIYKRLYDRFKPKFLSVKCLYTRRGGIDICPIRKTTMSLSSERHGLIDVDIDIDVPHAKTPRQ